MKITPSSRRNILGLSLALFVAALHGGMTPAEVAEFEAIKAKALKGDAAAEAEMATRIFAARGVESTPANVKEALRLCCSSAEKGNPDGQYALGDVLMHVMGRGPEAIGWWRKAAEQGHVGAQFNLGNAYRLGDSGVAADPAEAAKWYRKAAEQGHPYAQFSLALALHNGDGVKRDLAESIVWYRKSAEGGADKAQFNLGNAYWNGEGVAQDYAEAAKWYRKAAEQGMTQSQICLIDCLMLKSGGVYDPTEAYAWAVVASRSAPSAIAIVRELDGSLSPAELAAGKQRAKLIAEQIAARPRGRVWSR